MMVPAQLIDYVIRHVTKYVDIGTSLLNMVTGTAILTRSSAVASILLHLSHHLKEEKQKRKDATSFYFLIRFFLPVNNFITLHIKECDWKLRCRTNGFT